MQKDWNAKLASIGDMQEPLCRLLHSAADELSPLPQPVVVAACPNKFDDGAGHPVWFAVQVNRAWWERADYRINDGGDVHENALNPQDLPMARKVLDGLEAKSWRNLALEILQFDPFSVIVALVLQDNARWFVLSEANGNDDAIFLLEKNNTLRYVGQSQRLDDVLRKPRPLAFAKLQHGIFPYLHSVVPLFPIGSVMVYDADSKNRHKAFVNIVKPALKALNNIPGDVKYVASTSNIINSNARIIQADGKVVSGNTKMTPSKDQFLTKLKVAGETAEFMNEIIEGLDKAKWHELFASILPVFFNGRRDFIALLVRDSKNWIIANDSAVFTIDENDELKFVGACDPAIGYGSSKDSAIYLFDGKIF